MAVTQYIGARYVPLFADPVAWDNKREYEPLTIVQYQGNSYTSKRQVPTDVDINDPAYWVETGNYNAQVEQYRREVLAYQEDVIKVQEDVDKNAADIAAANADIATEKTARENAINAEQDARESEDAKINTTLSRHTSDIASNTDAIDEIRAKVENIGTKNVKDFGAKGDGKTDDRDAIQAALAGGGTVYLPAGTYYVSKALQPESDTIITGDGPDSKITSPDHVFYKKIEHSSDPSWTNVIFEKLNIVSRGGNGFELLQISLDDIKISDIYVQNCTIHNCAKSGFHLHGDAAGSGPYSTEHPQAWIDHCAIYANGDIGVCVSHASVRVSSCRIESNGLEGITFDNGSLYCTCINSIIKNNRGGAGGISIDESEQINIIGNNFMGNYGSNLRLNCNSGDTYNVAIVGNTFTGSQSYAISMGSVKFNSSATIVGNIEVNCKQALQIVENGVISLGGNMWNHPGSQADVTWNHNKIKQDPYVTGTI